MYYIWSLIVTCIIFAALQYNEYQQALDKTTYNLYTFSNLSTLLIIYLLSTIIFYMIFAMDYKCLSKIQKPNANKLGGGSSFESNVSVDPQILKRISEPMYTGFSTYDENVL